MKNAQSVAENAKKISRPSALLSMATILGCIAIYTSLELRSGAEAVRWGVMAIILFILSLTVRKDAGRVRPFPVWGYFIPLLLVSAFTAWDVSREIEPGDYEKISNGIADETKVKAEQLKQRTQSVMSKEGTLSRWNYNDLSRFMRLNNYSQRVPLTVSQDAARHRLQLLLKSRIQ